MGRDVAGVKGAVRGMQVELVTSVGESHGPGAPVYGTPLTGVGVQALGVMRCVHVRETQPSEDTASPQTDLQLEGPSRIVRGDKQADSGIYVERPRNRVARPVWQRKTETGGVAARDLTPAVSLPRSHHVRLAWEARGFWGLSVGFAARGGGTLLAQNEPQRDSHLHR